jgi:hypothetical protein
MGNYKTVTIMDKAKAAKVAAKYFPSYPDVSEFHVTSDEQVFEDVNHARNHAKSLDKESQQVFSVKKDADEVKEKEAAVELTPAEKLEAAKQKLTDATNTLAEKQQALIDATSKKKGAATIAVNKATNALQVAKDELTALQPTADEANQ